MGPLVILTIMCVGGAEEPLRATQLCDIHIRDPFIVPAPEEKKYYLFGTHASHAKDFEVYTSTDLKTWKGPALAFARPGDFWGTQDFWAPEVHRYRNRYYLFGSFKAPDKRRGTQVLVSDTLQGPYRIHSDGPVTPKDWECLDGTLYVDESGQPWCVFCHEWVQTRDGEICAVRLSPDLGKATGDPILLFRASEAPWVKEVGFGGPRKGLVTDGPFLHRLADGTLIMLWSTFSAKGYVQAVARSASGEIEGPWKQDAEPLFAEDGGHGMIFRAFDGKRMLVLHQPNGRSLERARLFTLNEAAGALAYEPWP
jgi:arabinan endo-1,5-alpha-L-arabinosidase